MVICCDANANEITVAIDVSLYSLKTEFTATILWFDDRYSSFLLNYTAKRNISMTLKPNKSSN
jgi:hypothetical protein